LARFTRVYRLKIRSDDWGIPDALSDGS
jgi:hypothetical protein